MRLLLEKIFSVVIRVFWKIQSLANVLRINGANNIDIQALNVLEMEDNFFIFKMIKLIAKKIFHVKFQN